MGNVTQTLGNVFVSQEVEKVTQGRGNMHVSQEVDKVTQCEGNVNVSQNVDKVIQCEGNVNVSQNVDKVTQCEGNINVSQNVVCLSRDDMNGDAGDGDVSSEVGDGEPIIGDDMHGDDMNGNANNMEIDKENNNENIVQMVEDWIQFAQLNVDGLDVESGCSGKLDYGNRLANTQWVANDCEEMVKDVKIVTPADIITRIRRAYGVNISYYTAWNAKRIYIQRITGCFDEGYSIMQELCRQVLLSNPGSLPCVHTLYVIMMRMDWVGFCSEYHMVAAYRRSYKGSMLPISDPSLWENPNSDMLPPPLERGTGIPRKDRRRSADENTTQ
ncbi:hypothetical protein GIB67_009812 [Kingdonia uniflora]|uniref:Uncharacterized protein n=1 Tax=Kingdonia uniflora TaxID=39325 RepID=A0A7J7MH23_9MAGN|nr:hypothetical protein GIB67_009812 [Kingdonia uniflora]